MTQSIQDPTLVPAPNAAQEPHASKHVAVWIDHREAHVFHLHPDSLERATVMAPPHHVHHRQPKGAEGLKGHSAEAMQFFQDVARSLAGGEEVLIVGPSTAKLEFLRHLHTHHPLLELKVVGLETVDHPTDRQLVAYAKTYFRHVDAMR